MKESTIQQQICEYLSILGIFYFSIPNEGIMTVLKMFRIPETTCYRIINYFKKMGLVPGMPDICVLMDKGIAVFFEVKNEKGELSERQERIHPVLHKKGFDVFVVRSVEDVKIVLNNYVKYK